MIGGLAAGIGRKLGIDPTWVRIIWVILAFATTGVAVLVYFVLLFVVPEETDAEAAAAAAASQPGEPARFSGTDQPVARRGDDGRSAALVLGLILVAVGAWFLVRQYLPAIDLRANWPWISIGFGVLLILGSFRFGRRAGG
jgi:phage shock protein PspC (stress-responsive transcriptional regulator)